MCGIETKLESYLSETARWLLDTMAACPSSVVFGAALVQKVELRVACKNLPNKDVGSKSDPCAVFYFKHGDKYKEYARTENTRNTLDPQFTKVITVDYHFEMVQKVRIRVYDVDNSTEEMGDDDFLGQMECTLGQIVSKTPFTRELTSKKSEVIPNCFINITAEECREGCELATMEFKAKKLDNKDFLSKSDPFLEISRLQSDGTWQVVHRTETVKDDLNPKWRPFTIPLHSMFGGHKDKIAKFNVFDWDDDGGHDLIGGFTCTFQDLCQALSHETSWPCINEKKRAKKSNYTNSGTVILRSLKIERVYSFLDFLFAGLQMNLTFGVDFTLSNGDIADPTSLHHINYQYPNEYMQAISAVGSVLQDYDTDKRFLAFGFGAKIPPHMEESFAFPLTLDFANPYCEGLQQVLDAYVKSVTTVHLWLPTNVAPILRRVVAFAQAAQSAEMGGRGVLSYHILLLLTDGVLSDMADVRDTLVEASGLPLSLIIVGVGDANFRDMNVLDGDDGVLKSTQGQPVKRDIVQFVPFREFIQKSPSELASHVLAEIPKQVTGYYKMRGIAPGGGL
ncbi:hypothetical protein RRG08_064692 [Elysia crispata]|uniref:Copine-3 n=1 Tax=Elysia crispata TaxID=231223 RepID=A0AAE1D784_9GAST|nr:hypothetical protein RRG08_064692 [Elysia crispata]